MELREEDGYETRSGRWEEDLIIFGLWFIAGFSSVIALFLEALFTVQTKEMAGICGWNNNSLGLARISDQTAVLMCWMAIVAGVVVFLLMRKEKKRLGLLIHKSSVWLGRHHNVGRLSAWVCLLSAFVLLINNTSTCFGTMAVSYLTTCLVGAVNLVAPSEDGIALSRWVLEQSIVLASLVAVREGGFLLPRAALFPILPALCTILAHKITDLNASNEPLLPTSVSNFILYGKLEVEDSQYQPIPDLDDKSKMYDCQNPGWCTGVLEGPCCYWKSYGFSWP